MPGALTGRGISGDDPPVPTFHALLLTTGCVLGALALWRLLAVGPLRRFHGRSAPVGFVRQCSNLWCHRVHRVQLAGLEHLHGAAEGGLLIVSNHTGAIDPFLIQAACPRLAHWMMATDMMLPALDDLWALVGVIPVDRSTADAGALRQAMRLLKQGEVVGIFPEGRITRPPGTIRPFHDGVGLLATRCGATVLPVLVDGTPETDSTVRSLLGPSRSSVRCLEAMQFDRSMSPQAASDAIREKMAAAAGWPLDDTSMPLELGWST